MSSENTSRRLIEGHGKFINDLQLPDMLHMAIVRSPHARAKVLKVSGGINASELQANLASVGEGATTSPGIAEPIFASDYVNYVGQPVAAVLGKDVYAAEDLLDDVAVDYEPLSPVIDPEQALSADPIHLGSKSNIAATFQQGIQFDIDAQVTLEDTLMNRRICPNPLEPRGLVAKYDGTRLTIWASTQSVHAWKSGLCASLKLDPAIVRVVQMDTGGAFGCKGGIYPEYIIASYAAMKTKKPVKWIETRMEHLMATHHGRGARAKMKIYAKKTGEVLGLKTELLIDAGSYAPGMGLSAPKWIGFQISGPYTIPNVFVDATAVFTNKVPLGPYRGAGRPEAAMFIERMMDLLADELKIDPVEVRMRNVSDDMFTSPLGLKINPFKPFLKSAIQELDYERRKSDQTGFSCFVLITSVEPGESAKIAVRKGRVKIWMGGSSHGQRHDIWAQALLSEQLDVSPTLFDIEHSDTDELNEGVGSWGSRTAVAGGAALMEASRKIKELVAEKVGEYSSQKLLEHDFEVTVFQPQEGQFTSFGANLVTAKIDELGRVGVKECIAYYDVGRPLNLALTESQVIGGTAQGIGQVFTEEIIYDQEGQPLIATIGDAGLPNALMIPKIIVKLAKVPSHLPHGAKGVGESPTMGIPPATLRAVERVIGTRLRETPIPIEKVTLA